MSLKLMYITNNEMVAKTAQENGVERIWVDLEKEGKEERQKGRDCIKSQHTVDDVRRLSKVVDQSELLVRVNPWNEHSAEEIEQVIAAGADVIMLPMWKSVEDVQSFLNAVAGRAKTTLLLETKEAVTCVDEVLEQGGFDEIHIGLNDLHLSYNLTFMFELLTNGTVEMLCNKFKAKGIPFGFGGIARVGGGLLPAEKIMIEHYRLGSTRSILSRSFCNVELEKDLELIFAERMKEIRAFEQTIPQLNEKDYAKNKELIEQKVEEIVDIIQSKR